MRLLTVAISISAAALVIAALVGVFALNWRTPYEIGNAVFCGTVITCGFIRFFMPKHQFGATIAEAKLIGCHPRTL